MTHCARIFPQSRIAKMLTAFCISVAFLMAFSPFVAGQTTFGSITGTVTDQTGAAIPGAQITVTDQATGMIYRGKTAADGVYTVIDVPVGSNYRARAEAQGFGPEERTGLVIYVHQVITVDFKLTVGSTASEVTVNAAAPIIDTQTGTIANTITGSQAEEMPVAPGIRQGIGVYAFMMYNPGVGVNDSGNFYANGTRQIDTYFSNDGIVDMQDVDGIGGAPSSMNLSNVSEMTAVTAGANAEYRSPTNFVLASKSGTNQIHGSLYYDWNGDDLNARNFFSATVPFGIINNWAASVGGPIRRDKAFFFVDYEGLRSPSRAVIDDTTPLPQWRTGNFSDLLSQGTIITNPTNGQPFPNNQIPASMLNSSALKAQSVFYPQPNAGPPGLQVGNWQGLLPNFFNMDSFDARGDYDPSEKDRFFARYTYHRVPFEYSPNGDLPPITDNTALRTGGSAVFSWTHSFSPGLLNEFRFGFARDYEYVQPIADGYQLFQQLGIQGIPTGAGIQSIPSFNITGITSTGGSSGYNVGTDFQWIDDLSWVRGSHSLKFGTVIIRDRVSSYGQNNVYGSYNFTGAYTGLGYADFLLGLPQTTSYNLPQPANYLFGTTLAFYAQDQWQITRRLTLNYGIRYELPVPYWEKDGLIFTYDPALKALVVPDNGLSHINPLFPKSIPIVSATAAGYPNPSLQKLNTLNFYPRIGFAYKLTNDGKTVIRGAYGIYGDTVYGTLALSKGGGPFSGSETFFNSITNGVPLFTLQNPFVTAAGQLAAFQNANFWDPNLRIPYMQQWNLTIQRQVGPVGLTVTYLGSHNVNLLYGRNINQPPLSTTPFSVSELPNQAFSVIDAWTNGSTDKYNALQVTAQKTLGNNLIINGAYTWARDLTDTPDNDWVFGNPIQNAFNRGPEWGNNLFTPTQRLYAAVIWALPIGKGQHFLNGMQGWQNAVFGGWRTAYVATLQSGQWFTPNYDGFDSSNTNYIQPVDGDLGGRPDRVPGTSLYPSNQSINNWFNANAFAIPGCPFSTPVCTNPADVGRFGNAAPNQLAAPGTRNLDFSLMKDFLIMEKRRLQFQAVFANVFNHPAFGYPAADISATSTVGVITSTVGNYLQGSSPERVINFVLRFQF